MDQSIEHSGPESSPQPTFEQPMPPPRAARRARYVSPSERRSTKHLLIAVGILLVAFFGPPVVGNFIYHAKYNELKAGYDIATGTLAELKPRLNDLELASRLIAKRVEPSVVSILRPDGFGRAGQGSGVIVDEEGFVVTNFHVVSNARDIQVQLSDGRKTAARLVGDDILTDLAVLKINLPNLIPAEWGDSDELQVGDLVWALGSPFGLDRSLTFGIVSAKGRRGSGSLTYSPYQEYLQTDAAVNPGNSGGALVNIEGRIVGINTAIVGPSYQGISFAIPSNLAQEKYEELKENGYVDRAWLGVEPLDVPDDVRERLGLDFGQGVLIGRVERDTPARRAGIRPGDVILKWNDHLATDPTLLSRTIAATEIGSTAKVVILRANPEGGSIQTELDVEVERRPRIIALEEDGQ